MSSKETNNNEERITDTNEQILMLIRNIMSDFTEVVKMLTNTMNTQLEIIHEQENNNLETARIHNQTMNRQLEIIESQNGFLKKIFEHLDPDDKSMSKIVELWQQRKQI